MTRGTLQYGGNTVRVWVDDSGDGIAAQSNRPLSTVKFRAFADKYKSEILPALKPASVASIKSVLGILCNSFGDKRLADIGTEDIQKFVTSSPYSPKTIKNHVGIMQMVFNKARAWNYVKHNPFEFLSMPRAPLTEARCLTVEEVRAIIRKTYEPFTTMLMILAETGIRGGELCGIAREDVDITNRVISIRRSAFQGKLQTPKTGSAVRLIAISGRLARHLSSLAGNGSTEPSRARNGRKSPVAEPFVSSNLRFSANSLLFSYNGRPWDNGEIVRRLKPVLGAGVGLHAFRHFSASLMASIGVPEHIRRERLGHSSGSMTAHYTHSSPEDHRKWAEAIGQDVCTENVYSLAMGAD